MLRLAPTPPPPRRGRSAPLLLGAFLMALLAAPAAAQTLVSNIDQPDYQYPSWTAWQYEIRLSDHRQQFTTGPAVEGFEAYRVDSVDIELDQLSDATTFSKITVTVLPAAVLQRGRAGRGEGGGVSESARRRHSSLSFLWY